jgi:hypothetical protein
LKRTYSIGIENDKKSLTMTEKKSTTYPVEARVENENEQ